MKNIISKIIICIIFLSSSVLLFSCKKDSPTFFTVTFKNTSIESISVKEGNYVPQPENPVKDGFTFDGWYSNPELSTLFDFNKEKVNADISIYAKWLKNPVLSYDLNGGSSHSTLQYTASAPEQTFNTSDIIAFKPGFTFTGWNTKKDGSGDNVDTIAISQDTTLYAQWELETSSDPTEQEFLTFLAKISLLEEAGYTFFNQQDFSNIATNILGYIRSERYSDKSWSMLAGTINSKFKTYVDSTSTSPDPRTLKNLPSFNILGQGQVDFVHMVGTLSLTYNKPRSYSDLGGWGGDCAQLATDLKNYDTDLDELIEIAKQKFRNGGYFSEEDYNADLDAMIISSYLAQGKTLSEAIRDYYNQLTNGEKRETLFFNIRFTNNKSATKEEFRDACYNSFSNNTLIQVWLDNNSTSLEEYENQCKASVYAFSDYLYENK